MRRFESRPIDFKNEGGSFDSDRYFQENQFHLSLEFLMR